MFYFYGAHFRILNHHLNLLTRQSKSYPTDTNHILLKLGDKGTLAEGALLCTIDVVGFYPWIPHEQGLEAMRDALDKSEEPEGATKTLVEPASLVLENNFFEFKDRIFRQRFCTAIWTKVAPAYANLFMDRLEERLLDSWYNNS